MQATVDAQLGSERAESPRQRRVIQSLDRGLVILESTAKAGRPISLSELAALFGIDRSSAFRLADTLKRRGFLACPRNSNGYILGPAMWRLAQAYDWSHTLVRIARPFLRRSQINPRKRRTWLYGRAMRRCSSITCSAGT